MAQRYAITHLTQFTYDEPVSESVMELRMRPLTSERQQCLQFGIDVEPRARTFAYQDALGNWVHHFNIPRRHRQLLITARAHVEVDGGPAVPDTLAMEAWREVDSWAETAAHWDFRQPSQFARVSDRLLAFMSPLGLGQRSHDPLTTVRRVMGAIFEQLEYAPRTTRVDSPVDEAIDARRGVCQDFSHIMIATLRHVGLPVRYVSGYIAPSFDSRPPADDNRPLAQDGSSTALTGPTSISSHAWVEVALPHLGWTGFDPTHNLVTGARHVRVAVGRDYADVPPTRGVFKGKAASSLEVSVNISSAARLDSPLEAGEVRPSAAAWSTTKAEEPQSQQQQQQQQQ